MIIGILGTIGSGKSISATKITIENHYHNFTNLNIVSNNTTRIKKSHILKEVQTGETKTGKPILTNEVNWGFWNKALLKYKDYNIILDEAHNLLNSRRSMSKWNILFGLWLSQIRKLLGNKEDTHLIFVSQRLKKLDNVARDLFDTIVYCQSFKTNTHITMPCLYHGKIILKRVPLVYVLQVYFFGEDCIDKYRAYRDGERVKCYKTQFIANKYFKFNDTFEIIGETAYL